MPKGEKRQTLLENLIYIIIWLTLLLTPVIENYYTHSEAKWDEVLRVWKMLVPFLALFLIHNYILIPLFLLRKRYWGYFPLLLITIGFVYILHAAWKPPGPQMNRHPQREMQDNRSQHRFPPRDTTRFNPENRGDIMPPPMRPQGENHSPLRPERTEDRRPDFFRKPFLMIPYANVLFMIILVIGLNLAIKLLFKSLRDDHRMKELERHNLQTELDYLKHQINPHFFMNTLNNIHALIDIDTEKAKETVLELSKMMRYLLYDSSQESLPLKNEVQFITNYIELMRIRYTDEIEIHLSVPHEIPNVQIPPLLFISFIENAFKHGISYQHESFIHISMEIKDHELQFLVVNSSFNNADKQSKGVGLDNIRKRLHLLYKDDYTLEIRDNDNQFHVFLIIPLPL